MSRWVRKSNTEGLDGTHCISGWCWVWTPAGTPCFCAARTEERGKCCSSLNMLFVSGTGSCCGRFNPPPKKKSSTLTNGFRSFQKRENAGGEKGGKNHGTQDKTPTIAACVVKAFVMVREWSRSLDTV